jgi:N-acetylmuramoyl-L-alanine amidase
MLAEPDSALVDELAASPNFGERRAGARPDCIILHYTGMPSAAAALALLCSPQAEVSSHYVVREDGKIVQLVAEAARAWHAGVSVWQGDSDLNSRSIGIEIANPGHDPTSAAAPQFPPRQIAAVIALCRDIVVRHKMPASRVLAHSDIAPQRKIDPGENFPWQRLHAAGLGDWVRPPPAGPALIGPGDRGTAVLKAQGLLAAYGYGLARSGEFDSAMEQVVRAFQRHFRPERVDGRLDASTLATLEALLGKSKRLSRRPRPPGRA